MCKKKQATASAKSKPETAVGEPVVACSKAKVKEQEKEKEPDGPPKPDPKVISVEFLDGGDDIILAGEGKQFVNLSVDDKWVDGATVLNKDRLSNAPRIKVKFDQAGAHRVTLTLVPGGSNAAYTDPEKGRNAKFKYQDADRTYTTGADGSLIVTDMKLSVAADDSYTVKAKDTKGVEVTSGGTVKTDRLFYYVEIKMTSLASAATSTGTLDTEFQSNFMTLKKLAAVEMDHMPNISTTDEATFKSKAKTAYEGSDEAKNHEPNCVAIAYTDHLAVKNPNQKVIKSGVEVGPGKTAVDLAISGPGLTGGGAAGRSLWKNLVPGEGWFVSCKYLEDGKAIGESVVIEEAKCVADPVNSSKKVAVSVDHLPAGTGSITLEVNWVDRMRGGLSFPGGNLICVCARAWWRAISTLDQNQVMIHEMGHKVGMVTDGTGKLPDAVPTLYGNAKGHVGNHCYMGNADGQARYDAASDGTNSTCVMYGATNGKTAFCANCKIALRKVDISDGWARV